MRVVVAVTLFFVSLLPVACPTTSTTQDTTSEGEGEGEGEGAEGEGEGAEGEGEGAEGAACSFNRDCAAALRCDCLDGDCVCSPGARGTGAVGGGCEEGVDCASAVCIEANGGEYLCTDECTDDTDCVPTLPRCLDVAFVGRICVRDPE